MTNDQPIACSLDGDQYPQRLEQMRALGRSALVDSEAGPTSAVLRFAAGAGIRARVDAIVAAEARCCAFMTMTVSDEPDLVVLTIDVPADAEPVLGELVAAFRGEAAA